MIEDIVSIKSKVHQYMSTIIFSCIIYVANRTQERNILENFPCL